MANPEMKYALSKRLPKEASLSNPSFAGSVTTRVIDTKAIVNAKRPEESFVAQPETCRNSNALELQVPRLGPCISEINEEYCPQFVPEIVFQALQDVCSQFKTSFKRNVAA
jgi:hypothetical protein